MKLILQSPITWFCGPFVAALVLLGANEEMPFFEYYSKALEVTILYLFLPFLGCYFWGLLNFTYISGKKWPFTHGNQLSLFKIGGLLDLWLIISAIEILVFPGLPIYYAILGGGKTYAEFGIPSVHGLANLLYVTLTMIVYMRWRRGESDLRWLLFGLVSWPILCASRGLFLMVLLILLSVHLMTITRIEFKAYLFFFISLTVIYFGFGYLGEIREKDFSLASALSISDELSPAWLWFYVYLTSPIANLVNTIALVPPNLSIIPGATLSQLVPTVIKPLLGVETGFDAYIGEPVMAFLNAGTAFRSPYLDWGIFGIVLVSAGFGGLAGYIRHRALRFGGLSLAYFNVMLLLNVFNNNFASTTFLVLFFVLLHIESKTYKQSLRISRMPVLAQSD
jgi:oligosaccharide repeat unit polymerase